MNTCTRKLWIASIAAITLCFGGLMTASAQDDRPRFDPNGDPVRVHERHRNPDEVEADYQHERRHHRHHDEEDGHYVWRHHHRIWISFN